MNNLLRKNVQLISNVLILHTKLNIYYKRLLGAALLASKRTNMFRITVKYRRIISKKYTTIIKHEIIDLIFNGVKDYYP